MGDGETNEGGQSRMELNEFKKHYFNESIVYKFYTYFIFYKNIKQSIYMFILTSFMLIFSAFVMMFASE